MRQVVAMLLTGLLVGALARMVLPGRQTLGCVATIAVGVVGGLLGGLVGEVVGQALGASPAPRWLIDLLFGVLGAVGVLLGLQMLRRR